VLLKMDLKTLTVPTQLKLLIWEIYLLDQDYQVVNSQNIVMMVYIHLVKHQSNGKDPLKLQLIGMTLIQLT